MADLLKVGATNVTDGPKVFNSMPPVIIPRGGATEGLVQITAAELGSMKSTGYFDITGKVDQPKGKDLRAAIDALDPKKVDHWTDAGLPAVDAVSALVGSKVTRAQIEDVAPDVKRPA